VATPGDTSRAERLLIFRVGAKVCGVPLERVIETMRPLPIEPLAQMPAFVRGLALIRGCPTAVLDARSLLGSESEQAPGRYVTLDLAKGDHVRVVAFAVDAVVGVRRVDQDMLSGLPGLLSESNNVLITQLGALDAELLLLLDHTRLLPDALWQRLEPDAEPA
jgi:purine-binding chemotaxis protein CheW